MRAGRGLDATGAGEHSRPGRAARTGRGRLAGTREALGNPLHRHLESGVVPVGRLKLRNGAGCSGVDDSGWSLR